MDKGQYRAKLKVRKDRVNVTPKKTTYFHKRVENIEVQPKLEIYYLLEWEFLVRPSMLGIIIINSILARFLIWL